MEANKKLSIKEASDEELNALLQRMHKEEELQNVLRRVKLCAEGKAEYDNFCQVSTEEPIESLYHKGLEEILEHHGIKGQRWGVRRKDYKARGGHASAAKETIKKKKNDVASKSNKQLQDVITRKTLEKQYKELSKSETQRFIEKVIKDNAQVAIKVYSAKLITKSANALIK